MIDLPRDANVWADEIMRRSAKPLPEMAARLARRSYDEEMDEHGRRRIALADTVGEIALRPHVEPEDWAPYSPRLDRGRYPDAAQFLSVVPVPGTEMAWFWVYDVRTGMRRSNGPSLRRVYYPERLPQRDVREITRAAAACGIEPDCVQPRSAFLRDFYRRSYRRGYRLPVAAWNLVRELALFAVDWEAAIEGGVDLYLWSQPDRRKKKKETRRRKRLRNGEIEHPRRPKIHVDPISGASGRISFKDRWGPDDDDRIPEGASEPDGGYQFRGRFVVASDWAYGLTGTRFDDVREAAVAFQIDAPDKARGSREIEALLRGAIDRVEIEARLYAAMLGEHETRGVPIHPHRVHSPGAYAWAMLIDGGVPPRLVHQPNFPREALAEWLGAFRGGENRIGMLVPPTVPLPVVPLDFTSGHVASFTNIGGWKYVIADRIVVRKIDARATERFLADAKRRVERWLTDRKPRKPLSDREQERLAFTLVFILPDGVVLPHMRRNGVRSSWRMQIGPLTYERPLPCTLLDVLRASIETGRIPAIARGHRLVARGTLSRLNRLQPATLSDGTRVEPGENLPLALSVFRRRLPPFVSDLAERKRLDGWSKLVANAMVSGLPSQVNRRRLAGRKARLHVWNPLGSDRIVRTEVLEEPGPFYFPPIAAAVTSAQRFLTFLACSLVEERGGHVIYIAIDALHPIATPDGRNVPCEGGPDEVIDPETGRLFAGYQALSFPEVERIRDAMETLSPYPDDVRPRLMRWTPPACEADRLGIHRRIGRSYPILEPTSLLLKLERENYDGSFGRRQPYVHARSPMRAFVYGLDRAGSYVSVGPPPRLVDDRSIIDVNSLKASEQSLGQLIPPPGETSAWIDRAAEHELKLQLGIEDPEPAGWTAPAIALIPVTLPGESKVGNGRDRRPGTVLAVLRPHPTFGPRLNDGSVAIPAAIWYEGFDWNTEPWCDFRTGEPLSGLHVGHRSVGEQRRVKTYAEVIRRHFQATPQRVMGPSGNPPDVRTCGLLTQAPTVVSTVRLIGREMNALDRTGITQNPEYSDYTDDAELRGLALRVIRSLGAEAARRVHLVTGIPIRSVRDFIRTGRTSKERWDAYIESADRLATEEMATLGLAKVIPLTRDGRLRSGIGMLKRVCGGCGTFLAGRQRRWCSKACQMAVLRQKRRVESREDSDLGYQCAGGARGIIRG